MVTHSLWQDKRPRKYSSAGKPAVLPITTLGLDAAGDIFTLPVPAEYDSSGHAKPTIVPAALTSTAHSGSVATEDAVFVPGGAGLVAGSGGGIGTCDADIEVQRLLGATPDPSFAITPIDFSGTEGCTRDGTRGIDVQAGWLDPASTGRAVPDRQVDRRHPGPQLRPPTAS